MALHSLYLYNVCVCLDAVLIVVCTDTASHMEIRIMFRNWYMYLCSLFVENFPPELTVPLDTFPCCLSRSDHY